MTNFPITKIVNVAGRDTPFTYPTHEMEDGSFEITGEKNNFPVFDKSVTQAVEALELVIESQTQPTDYPDEAVKTELESIKQTQQAILDRLDDPIDTQVTGSNVEYGDEVVVSIEAGATVNIIEQIKFLTGRFLFYVRVESERTDFVINLIWLTPSGKSLSADTINVEDARTYRTTPIGVEAEYLRIQIVNKSLVEQTFKMKVVGVN